MDPFLFKIVLMAGPYFHYFCSKCLACISLNVAFLVIGIILWLGGTSQFGQVIEFETGQWSSGAVVDIIANTSPQCPAGYDLKTAQFFGTKTICNKGSGYYTLTSCGRKEMGIT